MITNKKIKTRAVCLVLISVLLFVLGCEKAPIVGNTTEDVNITAYLDKHPDQYSEFRRILERSETSGFLQAYGAYTVFLPNNDAVKSFLNEKGLTSVDQLDKNTLYDLVTFHVIEDSLRTTDFIDGKLRNASMYGEYLVTGAVNENGISSILINKQARLITGNIKVGNGIIHVIDKVLKPAEFSIAQILKANPKYSIFTKALEETGYFDRLNIRSKDNPITTEKYLTVFAETNEVLAAAGFDTYEKLYKRYSKTGNPKNLADSLNLYVAYHITPQPLYFVDIYDPIQLPTFTTKNLSTSPKGETEVVINEIQLADTLIKGIPILRQNSDVTANNGVLHNAQQHFRIVDRPATALYWDVADQPEFRKDANWRKNWITWNLNTGAMPLKYIKWDKQALNYGGAGFLAFNGDILQLPLVGPTASAANRNNRPQWYEFTTPYLAPGNYKLWACYKKMDKVSWGEVYVSFNGKRLDRTYNYAIGLPTEPEAALEQAGWKIYMSTVTNTDRTKYPARLLGVVKVTEEGRQKIRLEFLDGSFSTDYCLDMFHFIPVDQDQLWPRFWPSGRIQRRGEPD